MPSCMLKYDPCVLSECHGNGNWESVPGGFYTLRQKSNLSFLINLTSHTEKLVIGTQQLTQNPENLRKNVICSRRG